MKVHKMLPAISLYLFLASTNVVFAGGSSVQINETNVRDKVLNAGVTHQLLMSFKVQSGNITVNNFDLHCVPAAGLTKLTLEQNGSVLDTTTFSTSSQVPLLQAAHFGANGFILPAGQETELSLFADVDANAKTSITTCAIDDLTFKDVSTGALYDSGAQALTFLGISKLIYIQNPALNTRDDDFYVIDRSSLSKNLALDSKNNQLATFTLVSSKQTQLQDLFVHCASASILKNITMTINGKTIAPTDTQVDWYTNSRPEHSGDKRIVFSNLGTSFGPGSQAAEISLYGDTYNYFSYTGDVWPKCEILDVMAVKQAPKVQPKLTITIPSNNATFGEDLVVKWQYANLDINYLPSKFSHYFIKLEATDGAGKNIQYGYLVWKNLRTINNALLPLGRGPFTAEWAAPFATFFQQKQFTIPPAWFDQNHLEGLKTKITLYACGKYDDLSSSTCSDASYIKVASQPIEVIYKP